MPHENSGHWDRMRKGGLVAQLSLAKGQWSLMITAAPTSVAEALRPPWWARFDVEPKFDDDDPTVGDSLLELANLLAAIAEGEIAPTHHLP
jgi:hypothetical protein